MISIKTTKVYIYLLYLYLIIFLPIEKKICEIERQNRRFTGKKIRRLLNVFESIPALRIKVTLV